MLERRPSLLSPDDIARDTDVAAATDPGAQQRRRAAIAVVRAAHDRHEARELLAMLGLDRDRERLPDQRGHR